MNNNSVINNQYSDVKINDRKRTSLTGVKKIISFNPEEFLIETTLGVVLIKGQELEITKLDTSEGILSIKGRFNSLNYMDNKNKESGIIARLFK